MGVYSILVENSENNENLLKAALALTKCTAAQWFVYAAARRLRTSWFT